MMLKFVASFEKIIEAPILTQSTIKVLANELNEAASKAESLIVDVNGISSDMDQIKGIADQMKSLGLGNKEEDLQCSY